MNLPSHELAAFRAVAQTLNFSVAAGRLFITQPALAHEMTIAMFGFPRRHLPRLRELRHLLGVFARIRIVEQRKRSDFTKMMKSNFVSGLGCRGDNASTTFHCPC